MFKGPRELLLPATLLIVTAAVLIALPLARTPALLALALAALALSWWLAQRLAAPLAAAQSRLAESRAQAERLQTERSRLLAVLEGMAEGVIAVDTSERIVHVNAAAGRILGVRQDELQGQLLHQRLRITALVETVRSALSEQRGVTGELRLPESGHDRVVELHATPLWSDSSGKQRATSGLPLSQMVPSHAEHRAETIASGGVAPPAPAPQPQTLAGAVVVLHDVTELRRLEAVRRDFVSNVSHELKTPLTAIRGLVETVLDDAHMLDETRRSFLLKTQAQAERLQALVSDLLTLSRVESQDGALDMQGLDLRRPVRAALSTLRPMAEARGVTLEVLEPDEPLEVRGDAEALRQAVGNLLDNAVKYTPSGGQVWLRLFVQLGHAVVEVEDTGIGIPPEDLARIFERFYRVDKARSREIGGTGLGLSIVKHIALAHGGNVRVSSRAGQGSTFRLELPLPAA